MKVSRLTDALLNSLEVHHKPIIDRGGETIDISRTVSAMANLYEKVRVAIEYREDHLLRRAAIERILKRRLMLNNNGRGIAEYLLKELLWAKYIPEKSIPLSAIDEIQKTVDKYLYLRNELSRGRPASERGRINDWLLSSAAAEVEEKIAPFPQREAFINFIYQYYRQKVVIKGETEETKDIQVYIGVHRSFAKSDDDFIRFHILKLSYPQLGTMTWHDMKDKTAEVYKLLSDIEAQLDHKIGQKLARNLKKEMAPFLVLRDMYERGKHQFRSVLEDEKTLHQAVDSMCRLRYDEIRTKLRTAGIRSIIYIFLTKMVFAIAIEYPLERYVLNELNFVALAVNAIVPPLLMLLAIIGNSPPGDDNTKRILARIREIVYLDSQETAQIKLQLESPKKRPLLNISFTILYLLAFIVVFGGITSVLTYFHFSAPSQFMFVFFVCVIIFFAYRIRQTGKEYSFHERDSVFAPVINFFLLPILKVGKWLSNEVSRFNFFVAVFDYLIEAPFKAIFEVFEEWFSFMKKQKDEIV